MKHWFVAMVCLGAAVVTTVGCQQQVFLSESAFTQASTLPTEFMANDPDLAVVPISGKTPAPPDVEFPDRMPRFMSLQEAIALGLENGVVSDAGGLNGFVNDNMVSFQGGGIGLNNQSDNIRVLAMNPAIAYNSLEQSLARFDAQWITAMNWSQTDNLVQGLQSFQNGNRAAFSSSVLKALPTGGTASMSFMTNYQFLSSPPAGAFGVINPFYQSELQFGFEQPLWRDFGVEINQLLNRTPGISGTTVPPEATAGFNQRQAALTQLPTFAGVATEGILIARLRFDSSRAEFERRVANMVANIEIAYWRLYQKYGELYSYEEALRIAHRAWRDKLLSFKAGRERKSEFYPLRGQFEEFRGLRTRAMGEVLEAERNLRGLIGLPVEDNTRLIPVTSPTLSPYRPNWKAALEDALNLRPELVLARNNMRAAQMSLITAKNFLKPDLRFTATYSPLGFGTDIFGSGSFVDGQGITRPSNAFDSLSDLEFNNWSLGFRLNVPIGRRTEHAAVRTARLGLAQAYYLLKDQEERAKRFLTQQYQKVTEWHQRIQMHRAERKAYAEALNATYSLWKSGADERITATTLLDTQRRLTNAQLKEYEAISEYQSALARFELAKGTMLQHDNVMIAEGPLPEAAQIRAVDNERRRTNALVLRERPAPVATPGRLIMGPAEIPETLEFHPETQPETQIDFIPPKNTDMPKNDNTELVPVPEDIPNGNPEDGLPGLDETPEQLPKLQTNQTMADQTPPNPDIPAIPALDGQVQPPTDAIPVSNPNIVPEMPSMPADLTPTVEPMPVGPSAAPATTPEVEPASIPIELPTPAPVSGAADSNPAGFPTLPDVPTLPAP